MKGGLAEAADVAVGVGYFLSGDLPFHGFQPFEFRGDAFPELRGRRLVSDYSLREMSLEDTYVQLVGDREVDTDAC